MKQSLVCGLAMVVLACGTGNTSSDSEAFIAWAAQEAVPVASLEGPLPQSALESLRESIGPARVVGMGESRHDTREQLLLKSLLVKHLITDLGFRAFILEESFSHAEAIDRYVTTGEGDLREVMNSLAGWYLWDTEEMLELIEWIREFNKGLDPSQHARVFGMDVSAPGLGVRIVLTSLRAAGIDSGLDAEALGLLHQRGDFWPSTWQRYMALSTGERGRLIENYDALIEFLKLQKTKLVASSSEDEYEKLVLLARIGQTGNAMFCAADRGEGGVSRERGMADTITWILERPMAGEKAILWAHNLHVAKSEFRMPGLAEGALEPMGVRLGKTFGDDYIAVGASFAKGSYPPDLPPGERAFETPATDVMDGALARVEFPVNHHPPAFLIDLRAARPGSPVAKWLRQEREWVAQDAQSSLSPSAAFDMVFFVREITRAQPTPLALRQYQTLGEQ